MDSKSASPRADGAASHLSGTEPLALQGDLAAMMVAGIGRFLDGELLASIERRAARWQRDFASPEAYAASVEPNRQRFWKIIGAADLRESAELHVLATPADPGVVAEGAGYKVLAVRWRVLPGVDAEGLLLQPEGRPVADVVALPDCDATPEMLAGLAPGIPVEAQFARRLAENGCRVLIPALTDRSDTWSGNPAIRMTNQPHREFLYRAAFEMGRHVIGFEVQKVLAAVDWFTAEAQSPVGEGAPIGVIGHGEGALLALYAAAADTRIDAAAVCGYFQPRERVWAEPIYRNVWALLDEFGDAELAGLVAPRALVIEACAGPEVSGPPAAREGRSGAAPGVLTTPDPEAVEEEFRRAQALLAPLSAVPLSLVKSGDGRGLPGSEDALSAFLAGLGVRRSPLPSAALPTVVRLPDAEARRKRQFVQLVEHTQHLMRQGEFRRADLWAKADATSVETWQESSRAYRDTLWQEVIGRFPPAAIPMGARTRLVHDEPKYRGYEVVLDVYRAAGQPASEEPAAVFSYGILLVPKGIQPGERRPVVVCQHGLEGRPQDVADPTVESPYYHQFACRLAERGFITYAPQNPYIGYDDFRVLQRKANPLKKSLFSFIVRQHERTLEWLSGLPCVDPARIAFYGLSYGGKTAMRVPALLEQYCLSICSGDFNEWIWKNVTISHATTYMMTGEYEMFEFDLGNTFNYAEMSWLICPRPFMVERGHFDGCAPDEWVGYEYAKTQRRYDLLGIGDRVELEVFNGPHAIRAAGTFAFLHRHLGWPEPAEA